MASARELHEAIRMSQKRTKKARARRKVAGDGRAVALLDCHPGGCGGSFVPASRADPPPIQKDARNGVLLRHDGRQKLKRRNRAALVSPIASPLS